MAQVFTMLIEGDKNPSYADLIMKFATSRDFFSDSEVTFYGRDSKSGELVQHSCRIWSLGLIAKSKDHLKIEGYYRMDDERPSVWIEKFDFTKKTAMMTYTLPKPRPGEVAHDAGYGQDLAVA
ncbi:MAG TPA: hypothetical protein PK295_00265 [Candidatus Magasanikbacteria bacterium]|nr:hypothetical protein [Candidatus Magasanikbacteria bacterium]